MSSSSLLRRYCHSLSCRSCGSYCYSGQGCHASYLSRGHLRAWYRCWFSKRACHLRLHSLNLWSINRHLWPRWHCHQRLDFSWGRLHHRSLTFCRNCIGPREARISIWQGRATGCSEWYARWQCSKILPTLHLAHSNPHLPKWQASMSKESRKYLRRKWCRWSPTYYRRLSCGTLSLSLT